MWSTRKQPSSKFRLRLARQWARGYRALEDLGQRGTEGSGGAEVEVGSIYFLIYLDIIRKLKPHVITDNLLIVASVTISQLCNKLMQIVTD